MGLLVLLPVMAHRGFGRYVPRQIGSQFTRGAVHTVVCACGSPRCRASRWRT